MYQLSGIVKMAVSSLLLLHGGGVEFSSLSTWMGLSDLVYQIIATEVISKVSSEEALEF